jgi:hypothetical protein
MPSLRLKNWRPLWAPCVYSSLLTFAAAAETGFNPHAHEPIATVRQMYDGTLMPDLAVATFRNIDRLFPTRTVRRGPTVQSLPAHERPLENVRFNSGGKD